MEIKITLEDVVKWSSRDVDFALDLTKVDADKLADLVATAAMMGFRKAGVDAAASAAKYAADNGIDVEAATRELTEKKIAVWLAGDWGATRGGDGRTTVEKKAAFACRRAVKESDEKAYKAMSPTERDEACFAYFDGLDDAKQKALLSWAETQIEIERKAREARDAAFADLGIDV